MTKYLVLLYGDETLDPAPETPEFDAMMAGYAAFDEVAASATVGGEALLGNADCRTIRHDGGRVLITDGPFAETVEGLGGFYVFDVPTLDDAIELARQIPAALTGAVELRPMVEWFVGEPSGERWLATIQGPEGPGDVPNTPEWEAGAAAHGAFVTGAGAAVIAGGAIHPTTTATTVKVRDGELLVTDGPFSEAREVVGGFYVIGGDVDAATAVAQGIPVNDGGAVELRPIMAFEEG